MFWISLLRFSFLYILGVLRKLGRASDCVNMQSRLVLNSWFLSLYLLSTAIINMHCLALKFLFNLILKGVGPPKVTLLCSWFTFYVKTKG